MALLTLAEAKAQLDIDTSTDDLELQVYVNALTATIERHVGPVEIRTVTETVNSRGPALALTQAPVASLTSLTPLQMGGTAVAVEDVYVDPDSGVVRRADGGNFYGGPWRAVYQAGRGSVPPTINLAARILLQHLWRTQYGASRGLSGVGGGDDYSVTEPVPGWGYAIPNRVLQLLEPYKVPPGVA
ncbi:phage gp6-like head-tail connector protein [Streptomyces sp. NBC_00289]|uniref:head-tail connector protein n=1 Tax=Streptomyces sp. NBC_00289 TaxID=2975703 RepID=UPI003243D36D